MRLKKKGIVLLIMVFLIMIISGATADVSSNSPTLALDEISHGYSIFLFPTIIMDTSYLSGNSDSGTEPRNNVYLQPAGGGNTGDNSNSGTQNTPAIQTANPLGIETHVTMATINTVSEIAEQEKASVITSESGEMSSMADNVQQYGESSPNASTTLSKIPSSLKISCLVIDAVISGLLLYLAVTKRI